MPPAAAFECDLTGWTFDMIATVAPPRAAARAARWPASPAPMIRTSCAGIWPESIARLAALRSPPRLVRRPPHARQLEQQAREIAPRPGVGALDLGGRLGAVDRRPVTGEQVLGGTAAQRAGRRGAEEGVDPHRARAERVVRARAQHLGDDERPALRPPQRHLVPARHPHARRDDLE